MGNATPEVTKNIADAFDALKRIAAEHNVHVHVSAIPPEADEHIAEPEDPIDQKRADFLWLQAELQGNKYLADSVRGNYVGVYKEQIIAKSPNYGIARLCVGRYMGYPNIDSVPIVPIQVRDQEAEQIWRNLQNDLGMPETT